MVGGVEGNGGIQVEYVLSVPASNPKTIGSLSKVTITPTVA